MLVSSLPSPAPGHRDHPPTRRPTPRALSQWIPRLPPAPLLTCSTALRLHVSSFPSNNRNPLPHRQLADLTYSRLLDRCQRGFQLPGRGTCHACPAWSIELRQGRAEVILGEHLQQEVGGEGWGSTYRSMGGVVQLLFRFWCYRRWVDGITIGVLQDRYVPSNGTGMVGNFGLGIGLVYGWGCLLRCVG